MPSCLPVFADLLVRRMATVDLLHARDDAGKQRVSALYWLHEDPVDADIERGQELLEQPPRV